MTSGFGVVHDRALRAMCHLGPFIVVFRGGVPRGHKTPDITPVVQTKSRPDVRRAQKERTYMFQDYIHYPPSLT